MLLSWTAVQPSLRERRWLRAGQLCALVGLTAAITALMQASPPNWLLAVVLSAAAVGLLWPRQRMVWHLAVDDDGRILARRAGLLPERHLQCVFAAPWLVTFRVDRQLIPVWPDALPAESYRRLWVYLRWGLGRSPAADSATAEDKR